MASFPDNLPPESLDPFYRALIYLGIVYFIATAFTTWILTRRRPKSGVEYREVKAKSSSKDSARAVTQISFEDSRDMLASLKVEIAGAEASLSQLTIFKDGGEISGDAYSLLQTQYSTEVSKLTSKMNEMLQADIVSSSTGEIATGMTDEAIDDIEADLEKQLQELEEEDDFLAPRTAKRKRSKIAKAPEPMAVKTTVTEPIHEKVKVTNPPPPTAAVPIAETPAAPAPTPTQIVDTPPAPTAAAPPPPAAPTANIPPPPTKPGVAPTPTSPQAAQPMKVESAEPEKEKIFAKSTSIAALRMDMLRELARLKKLINEDE
ncbi:MAG: hypothetical protein GPJ54_10455 [Candidatus Heimdallarchaeota archaeon]|nr:hypothetical protein [Candidatus Heimdallarchaeota archaeon]